MHKLKLFLVVLLASQLAFAQNNNGAASRNTSNKREMQNDYNASRDGIKRTDSSVMTDEEIMQFIKEEQSRGTDNKTIVLTLLKKGVTKEHLNRIRQEYVKREKNKKNIRKNDNEDFVRTRENQNLTNEMGYFKDSLDVLIPDSMDLIRIEEEMNKKIKIFGHNIFKDKELNFEPNLNISTPANYKLGPGDEVIVDIWGATQSSASGVISPDGYINVENLGLVYLNGMTVKEADAYLKEQFGQIYAGITADTPNANIKLTLTGLITIN